MATPIDLDSWIKENLFNVVPMSIAVIDQEFNLVYANRSFEQMFGSWKDRKCYSVYKNRSSLCPDCKGAETFKDGASRVNSEVGYDKSGRLTCYIKHTIPVVDDDGNIPFLMEMATDVTETEQIRREHQLLFDQVPCNILVIDRDFRIVKTNKNVREILGDIEGKHCFQALKGLDHQCSECTARQSFADGKMHTGLHIWKSSTGEELYSQVTTVPLDEGDGVFNLVMEMAVDITQNLKLEDELKLAHAFMGSMIATSIDGRIALDNNGEVSIFNSAAREIFKVGDTDRVTKEELALMLPGDFLTQVSSGAGNVYLPETEVQDTEAHKIPARLSGVQIMVEGQSMGKAFMVQDLREIRQLESEKLEAERLAAVGQTVAGLAHGVKNLITGLEGGMYMLNSGINKSNIERVEKGMEMLDRNISRVSTFVKEFLNFSKGRIIKAKLCDPVEIVKEVVDLYSPRARELGITLISEQGDDIQPASMDNESMHECLTNLVGNAIDACRMSEDKDKCHVWVRISEKNNSIIYEVTDDGCGMEYEVKKKVFTTFFTTKGLGGTGIGLLMTKKIVQEHGGHIEMESEPGQGTTFRITLDRARLPKSEGADTA